MKQKETESTQEEEATPEPSTTLKASDIPEIPDQLAEEMDDEEETEVMYGAPDDVAWTDKSQARRDAENAEADDPNKVSL